ncbi:MAG: RagB/SusD family nutrient uptake outer membrane protein [Prevotella sp.]|nr:RagB/SusD family nutrient uptake outer membrane protein [Prevotella sp.]
MKNIVRYIAIAISASALFAACVSLDTTPTYQFSSENTWKSPILARAAVNGVYKAMCIGFTENYTGNNRGTPLDCMSSVMDIDKNWRGACIVTQGGMTPSHGSVSDRYRMYYEVVYRANDVINNIDNVEEMAAAERGKLKAEATFLRAWGYYYLNMLWRGVPLYLENVNPDEANLPRSTEAEVWNQIITDLTACINEPNLPNKTTDGRVSKGAAYAYRGIAYQNIGNWSSALADFEAIEKLGYKLYSPSNGAPGNDDFFKMLRPENENNDEFIFKVNCIEQSGQGNPRSINYGNRVTGGSAWDNYLPNPGHVERFENADGSQFDWEDYCPGYSTLNHRQRIVFFLRDGLKDGANGVYGEGAADFSEERYQNMVDYCADGGAAMTNFYLDKGNEARIRKAYENRDPRLEMSIITPYAEYYGNASGVGNHWWTLRWPYILDTKAPYDIRTDAPWAFYYLWRKYVAEGDECTTRWVYSQDISLVRYAEILLRRAECLNELGRTSEAVQYVDMVRARAGHIKLSDPGYKGTDVSTQAGMREKIRNEFYVELGGEDSMYYNELRWGTWHQLKFYNYTQYADDASQIGSNGLMEIWGQIYYSNLSMGTHSAVWPIPQREREMNPNLTQNPGWVD